MAKFVVNGKANLDSKGFEVGTQKMKNSMENMKAKLGGIKTAIAAAFTGGVIATFVKQIVSAFSTMEVIEKQFSILFRNAEQAKVHLKDLQEFSAKTPFQLKDIATASRLLFTFSDGALGGRESLELVGDAAAATNQQIGDVAMWVGRAYSAIKSGRPFGEAAQRLQEMGILTGRARNEMEKMEDAEQIWNHLLGTLRTFEGGMIDLSTTTAGKISTMKDNWTLALAAMGEAVAPFVNVVLLALTKIAEGLQFVTKGWQQLAATAGALSTGASLAEAWDTATKQVFGDAAQEASTIADKFTLQMRGAVTEAKKTKKRQPQARFVGSDIDLVSIGGSLSGRGGANSLEIMNQQLAALEKQLEVEKSIDEKIGTVGTLA